MVARWWHTSQSCFTTRSVPHVGRQLSRLALLQWLLAQGSQGSPHQAGRQGCCGCVRRHRRLSRTRTTWCNTSICDPPNTRVTTPNDYLYWGIKRCTANCFISNDAHTNALWSIGDCSIDTHYHTTSNVILTASSFRMAHRDWL